MVITNVITGLFEFRDQYESTPNFVTLSAHRARASISNVFRNTSALSRITRYVAV